MVIRKSLPALTSRPLRQIALWWLVIVLFVSLKGVTDITKQVLWGFGIFAGALLLVWCVGLVSPVRRLLEAALDDGTTSPNASTGSQPGEIPSLPNDIAVHSTLATGLWWLAGFALVAAALAFSEWRQPYFFVQDDNLAQFFPVVLQGCRGFFHDGAF